jgi:murein L,D-transpeptidase YcbB/YkuD
VPGGPGITQSRTPGSAEETAAADSEAIAAFQTSQGLEATGTIDDATRSALEAAHGS